MTYSALSTELQNLFMYSFETRLKVFLLFGLLAFCLIYLFWIHPKLKETGFFSVGFARIMMFALSVAIIPMFPFMLGLLSPEYSLADLVYILLYPYGTFLALGLLIIVVDVLHLGIPFMMKLANFDMQNRKVNQAYKTMMRFSKKYK